MARFEIGSHPGQGKGLINGGKGLAHLNMNNADNRIQNLKYVSEAEARKMLMKYVE